MKQCFWHSAWIKTASGEQDDDVSSDNVLVLVVDKNLTTLAEVSRKSCNSLYDVSQIARS